MKLTRIVALVTVLFTGMALAGMQELAAELPSCAVSHSTKQRLHHFLSFSGLTISQLKCLVAGIKTSECEVTDQTCICTNAPLNLDVNTCVKLSCTIRESLSEYTAGFA